MVSSSPPGTNDPDKTAQHLDERDRRLLAGLDEEETLALLCDLVARPSENPPGNELSCARTLNSWLEGHGVACELVEVAPGRPNLYATLGGSKTDRFSPQNLVLCGHLDTVPAGEGWTHDPFKATLLDGLAYGRGTCDMKAGLAAMAAAMVAVARSGVTLRGTLALHGVIDEEVGSAGAQEAASRRPGDFVIVGEPSGGRVFTIGNGQANFEITFHGKAVHSSHPEDGRNAICDAAAFIRYIEEETGRLSLVSMAGIGPATYSVGLIEGGRGGSTVADRCQLILDRRLLPTETLEDVEEQLGALLGLLGTERPGLSWELSRTVAFPPLRGRGTEDIKGVLERTIADLGGTTDGEDQGMRFATDAAWYEAAGCPAVVFGPGDVTVAHQPDEHVAVSELHAAARTLAVACGRLLA